MNLTHRRASAAPGLAQGAALLLALALAATAGCRPPGPAADSAPPLRVGYMICNSLEETRARFEPMTRYLSRGLGRQVTAVYLDTMDFPEAWEKGEFDLTHTNSLLYVIMHEKGLLPLAGERRGSMGSLSAGGIMVRRDSPILTLGDLRGKRMVFGPAFAPTAFLSQYDLLLRAGVDPEQDLGLYSIPAGSWKHEKVLYGVWLGAWDAAAVPMLDYEEMVAEGKIGPDDLRTLAVNQPIPYCCFGVSPRLDGGTVKAVTSLLMNLTPEDSVETGSERLLVLKAAGVDGFVPVSDGDFEPVRAMARRAGLPPYERF